MNVLIIDDEPNSLVVTQHYLQKIDSTITIVGLATNLSQAVQIIQNAQVDVIFLDLMIGDEFGLHLFNLIDISQCAVVVLSAHKEFGLQAIKCKVADYLLKPIDMEELQQTIITLQKNLLAAPTPSQILMFTDSKGKKIIKLQEIIYIKADGNYCNIICTSSKYTITKRLGELELELHSELFLRSHKSYLVNSNHIYSIAKSKLKMSNGHEIDCRRGFTI